MPYKVLRYKALSSKLDLHQLADVYLRGLSYLKDKEKHQSIKT